MRADLAHEAPEAHECKLEALAPQSVKPLMLCSSEDEAQGSGDEAQGSGEFSDFASVTSQDDFFDPEESGPVCVTFALDDPTRDAAEERSRDTRSPDLLDLQDRAADGADDFPASDLSIDECLLDLVNHIPPKFAQKIGSLLQRFEAVQRVPKPANKKKPGMDEDEMPSGSADTMLGHADDLVCRRQIEDYEQAASARQEKLEQEFLGQQAELVSEAKVLRDELKESRERFSILQQLAPTDSELRHSEAIQLQSLGGEFESMSTALANASSKLVSVGVCLEVATQHSDHFQDEASSAKLELNTLRLRSEEATARLQCREDQRDRLGAEAKEMEETQLLLRTELAREAHKRKEAEERLGKELQDALERSEAAATAKAQLELLCDEVEEVRERLLSSQRIEEQLHEELAHSHTAQESFLAESASARVKSTEMQENLQQQLSRAEASAQQRGFDLEQAEAEIKALQRSVASEDVVHREFVAEQTLVGQLRREAQTEEESLRSQIQLANAERDQLRQQMDVADAALSRSVSALASNLASATAEQDEFCRGLQQEREQMLEQRMRTVVLTEENEELRSCQETLCAKEMQAQREAAFAIETTEAHAYLEQCRASEFEERCIATQSEMDELRRERLKLEQMEQEQRRTAAVVNGLIQRVQEMAVTVQQGHQEALSSAAEWERSCLERACSEEELAATRLALAEERSLQSAAESESASLVASKEKIQRRMKSAEAEIDRSKTREKHMVKELVRNGAGLRAKTNELHEEVQQTLRQKLKAKELQVSQEELRSCLQLEGSLAKTVAVAAAGPVAKWFLPHISEFKTDVQVLREELNHSHAHLEKDHRCAPQPGQSSSSTVNCQFRGESEASQRQSRSNSEASQRHSADAAWILSEQLKEVEEEGKVRKQQLEAETSLMEMEVVTLTKGLGCGTLSGGIMGLSSTPLNDHDIKVRLSPASGSASIPHGCNVSGIDCCKMPPPGGGSVAASDGDCEVV